MTPHQRGSGQPYHSLPHYNLKENPMAWGFWRKRIKGDVALFLRSYVPFNLSHLQTLHSDSTTEITEDTETKKPDYFLLRVLRVVEPVY
jgi:hypothetical protein